MTMWRNALRRSTPRLVSTIIGAVVATVGLLVLGTGLVALGWQPLGTASLTVPLFSTLTLLWVVLSVVAFGVDATVDPRRFAVLPVRAPDLARGLFVAAFAGIPALFLTGLAVEQVVGWAVRGWPGLAAAVAAVLGVSTSVLLSRVVTTALARTMSSRRGRDLAAVVVSLITIVPMTFNLLVTSRAGRLDAFHADATATARVVGWTPVGWAWALPDDVARAEWLPALAHLALASALLAVLWRSWIALLARELTSPLDSAASQRVGRGRFLPALLGTGAVASIAARRIRAWRRDSRLVSIGLRTLVIPVVMLFQAVLLPGGTGLAGIATVILAVMAGLTLMNDLAFDGPAWWIHLATSTTGAQDRWGRVVSSVVVFGPVVALTYAASVVLGLFGHRLAWLAVIIAVFLVSLGVASVVGAWTPGSAPRSGGNPFAANSGSAATGCVTTIIAFVGPVLLSLPVIVGAALARDSVLISAAMVAAAVAWGGGILWGAVHLAGRRLDTHGPEMLASLRTAPA
ncbi:MAG: hypothetical protein ABI131_07345 [Nostocoides sp.]